MDCSEDRIQYQSQRLILIVSCPVLPSAAPPGFRIAARDTESALPVIPFHDPLHSDPPKENRAGSKSIESCSVKSTFTLMESGIILHMSAWMLLRIQSSPLSTPKEISRMSSSCSFFISSTVLFFQSVTFRWQLLISSVQLRNQFHTSANSQFSAVKAYMIVLSMPPFHICMNLHPHAVLTRVLWRWYQKTCGL